MDDHGQLKQLEDSELIRRKVDGELDAAGERVFRERVAADARFAEAAERALALQRDLASLPAVDDPGSGLTDRIMDALPAAPATAAAPPAPGPWSVLARPIPVWLAACLVLAAGAVVWLLARSRPGPAPAPAPIARRCKPAPPRDGCAGHPTLLVRFSISAPGASDVHVVGDFNSWSREATPLQDPDGNGVWTISLPLTSGRYQYKFLIDGRWVVEPDAPSYHPDGFGGRNSLLSI
jgi:anti-sigma factor RsiW